MPVTLPAAMSEQANPSSPKAIVWVAVFALVLLAGAAFTLLTWPKGTSTHTVWFWICLLAFPALAGVVIVGLRLHYFDDETNRLDAQKEVLELDRAQAIRFAREPLALLGSSYLCAIGNAEAASSIARKMPSALKSQTPRSGRQSIRHSALILAGESTADRYVSLFEALLAPLKAMLIALPRKIPFEVFLQLPPDASRDVLLAQWSRCWERAGCSAVDTSLLDSGQDLMAVDAWLDLRGGPALEKITLVVAAQLHDDPPEKSAEAGVALLLGWAPLVERAGFLGQALMHRPVATAPEAIDESLKTALLWGDVDAADVHDLWQAGLVAADKASLMRSAADIGLEAARADGSHDLDSAIGNSGVAAGWLLLALALEHAQRTLRPQLVVTGEHPLQLVTVRPLASQPMAVEPEA